MSRTLAIVPPAPALISGLAAEQPAVLGDVLSACDRAVAAACSRAEEIHVVAALDRPRDLAWPAGPRPDRHDDAAVVLAGSAGQPPPVGWLVADHLLARVGCSGVRQRRLVPDWPDEGHLLVMADGSAARGPRSPRAGAPGEPFDAALESAVRDCDVAALARLDDTSAARVGCGTAAVWRGLAELAPAARCLWLDVFHPLGVTYLVGVWELD